MGNPNYQVRTYNLFIEYCYGYVTYYKFIDNCHGYHYTEEKDMEYGTRHQEAVKIFNNLLSQETLADPIKLVQNILSTCFNIADLQSEVRKEDFICFIDMCVCV